MDHIGEFQQCKTCSGETQPVYRSTIDTALKIIKLEGVQSLWRGILPSLMMQLPSTVFYYTLYDKIKLEFQKNLENENELIFLYSGMIARTITTSITSPFDFLKTSIQSSNKSTKSREIISSIIKQHGIKF
jgi:solute carrier family 25, member 39/40